jgi:ATP-binding cassette, subfamily B, bacterial
MSNFRWDTGFRLAFTNLIKVLNLDRKDIINIYLLATFSGILYLALPLAIQSIVNLVVAGSLSMGMVVLIFIAVLALFFNGFLQIKQLEIIEKVEQKIFVRYTYSYIDTLPKINLQEVDSYYLPEQVNRFFDLASFQKSIYKLLLDIPTSALQILIGTILLSFYHVTFFVFGLMLLMIIIIILRITSPMGYQKALNTSNYKYFIGDWLEQVARNIKGFKFNNQAQFHTQKSDHLMIGYLEHRSSLFRVLKTQYWTLVIFKVVIMSVMLILGVNLLLNQQISIGQFIAADIVILGIIDAVEKFIKNIDNLYEALASLEKLEKVTRLQTEQNGKVIYDRNQGMQIKFDQVSFSYPNHNQTLKNLSFDLNKSEWLEIYGAKNTGKSTVINLLSGSYPDYQGKILINDIPLASYETSSIRNRTGVLLQKNDLFDGTILENLTLDKNATLDQHTVNLCKILGLHPFINDRREGYLENIEIYRNRIDGEIRSKILLARAILKNNDLLLLEDPFQYLTNIEQQNVIQYLKDNGNPTVIIINNTHAPLYPSTQKINLNA